MLHKLVKSQSARFADLRPKNTDSNLATYHLQQLTKQKLVKKHDDGHYYLTSQGKIIGATVTLTHDDVLCQAHSVLFLALQNSDGLWLLRKRLVHPMYGMSGFVHGEPTAKEPIAITAHKILEQKTGLTAKFTPKGSGYITLMDGDNHQSFINFTMLIGTNVEGNLRKHVGNGENYWYEGDFSEPDMLPSMLPLIAGIKRKGHFYIELTY